MLPFTPPDTGRLNRGTLSTFNRLNRLEFTMSTRLKNFPLLTLAVLSLIMVFSSCSQSGRLSSQDLPSWVTNPKDSFDEHAYLMAVGSGSSLKQAQNDAKGNIAQIFKAEIKAQETLIDEFREYSNDENYSSSGTTELLQVTRIGSNQDLTNVKILTSTKAEDGTFYALAAMDRNESARIYRREIADNELKINNLLSSADQEESSLQRMILLKKGLTLAKVNENLARQLQIIKAGAADTELHAKTITRIEERYRAVQKQLAVHLSADEATETLMSAVGTTFQNSGFSLTASPDEALLSVIIRFNSEKADLNRNDAEFVKWNLIITIEDHESNRSFNTFMTEGRDGGPSFDAAMKRADFSAREKVGSQFKNFLTKELLSIQ